MVRNTRESLEKQWPMAYAICKRESLEIYADLVEKGKIQLTYEEWIAKMKEEWIEEMLNK